MELTLFNEKEQDDTIFEMFDYNDNDNFLDMSEKEVKEFLLLLERYCMFYRDKLNIKDKNTFGTEIECVNANILKIINSFKDSKYCGQWKYKNDTSLPDDKKFIEVDGVRYVIKSKEFITDILNNKSWNQLYEGCYIISNNAMIDNCCGGHVHVGSQVLGRKKQNWLDFFSLWSAYEDIIYRFSSGCDSALRDGGVNYASPVSLTWQKKLKKVSNNVSFERLINVFGGYEKNNAVNLGHVDTFNACDVRYGNTLEFRTFNGVYDPIVIQNNINFVVHLLEYASSNDFDIMTVFSRRNELKDKYDSYDDMHIISSYNNMDIYKSMELADMIFSNNLDKINFLKQYVKSVKYFNEEKSNNKKLIK